MRNDQCDRKCRRLRRHSLPSLTLNSECSFHSDDHNFIRLILLLGLMLDYVHIKSTRINPMLPLEAGIMFPYAYNAFSPLANEDVDQYFH